MLRYVEHSVIDILESVGLSVCDHDKLKVARLFFLRAQVAGLSECDVVYAFAFRSVEIHPNYIQ